MTTNAPDLSRNPAVGQKLNGQTVVNSGPPGSGLFVDVPPVSDVQEKDTSRRGIELVEHAVIAHAQPAFAPAREAVMLKGVQAQPHLVNLRLNGFLDAERQGVERPAEGGRPDLQRGGHGLLRLARAIASRGDVLARFIKPGFDFVRQFKAVFVKFVEPRLQVFKVVPGQLGNRRFDFLHGAHSGEDNSRRRVEKWNVSLRLIEGSHRDQRTRSCHSIVLRLGTAAPRIIAAFLLLLARNTLAADVEVRLTIQARDANRTIHLELNGPAPGVFRLEASEDLTHWQPIATNVLVGGTLTFTDAQAKAAPRRFYRAVLTSDPPYQPGVVLLRFKSEANAATTDGVMDAMQMHVTEEIFTPAMEASGCPAILCAHTALTVPEAVAALNAHPAVEFAEPNYILTHSASSNDPRFTDGSLWGMYGDASSPANAFGSQTAEAWAQGYTGSRQVFVGVIDEGIQFGHPDLAANIWINPFDPPNGRDDDGNGYADDVNGWDFFSGDTSVFDGSPDSPSIDAHGTHVAGTIGAVGGNGRGVAGVNWQVTMISGKFLGPGGGWTSDAIKSVDYFTDLKRRHGLNIVALNNSWGGGGYSRSLHESILRAAKANILFIAAAQNSGSNNDTRTAYPCNYDTRQGTPGESAADYDAVISVAAIDRNGSLASFSCFGPTTVDLGAPGVAILSTVPWLTYAGYNGTSMATPHVTGAAALYASTHPGASAVEIRAALLDSTIPTSSLAGRCVTGGRLNLSTVIQPPLRAPSSLDATFSTDFNVVFLSWFDNSTNETGFRIERSVDGGGFTTLAVLAAGATFFADDTFPWNATLRYRVRALKNNAASDPSNVETVSTPAPPRLLYVDATYRGDHPDGSPGRPYRTICQAHATARDGDILRIRANTYRENCIFSKRVRLEPIGGTVVASR